MMAEMMEMMGEEVVAEKREGRITLYIR